MELTKDIEDLHHLLQKCLAKIASLEAENAELRSRLGMDSSNNHKPPSSDGYKKKVVKLSIPKEKGKKRGGQKGHQGKSLEMVSMPDISVIHLPTSCSCCGKNFSDSDCFETSQLRRQVFDIPTPRLEVIEHRLGKITCCGQLHIGTFPYAVAALVQYGVRGLTLYQASDKGRSIIPDKVAMSFRTLKATRVYARIQGIIKTIRKQGLNLFEALVNYELLARSLSVIYELKLSGLFFTFFLIEINSKKTIKFTST